MKILSSIFILHLQRLIFKTTMVKLKNILAFSAIAFYAIFIHFKYMSDSPIYIHGWTQGDKLSLTEGFIDNNFNFFKPETYILNKQFPDNFQKAWDNSITSVDFPIHEFVVAIIMKISGSHSPAIYKWYAMILAIVGLFYLYKTFYHFTNRYLISLLATSVIISFPVYFYYLNTPIPSNLGLSTIFIGFYYYTLHLDKPNNKYRNIAYVLFTLSCLVRGSLFVFLFAIYLIEFVQYFFNKTRIPWKSILLSFVCIAGYFVYNKYLASQYGSIFLSNIAPFRSFDEFRELVRSKMENIFEVYFSKQQWWLFLICLFLSFFCLRSKNYKLKITTIFGFLVLAGYLTFFILMGRQFKYHDYYFIDTLFIPMILLTLTGITLLTTTKFSVRNIAVFIVLSLFSFKSARNTYAINKDKKILQPYDYISIATLSYKDGDKFLDSLSISKSEKITAFGAYSSNNALYGLKRKGYSQVNEAGGNIRTAGSFPAQYATVPNAFFYYKLYLQSPETFHQFKYVGTNGKITLLQRKSEVETTNSFEDFIHLGTPAFQTSLTDTNLPTWMSFYNVTMENDSIITTEKVNDYENIIEIAATKEMKHFHWAKIEAEVLANISAIFEKGRFEVQYFNAYSMSYWQTLDTPSITVTPNEWSPITVYVNFPDFIAYERLKILFYTSQEQKISWKNTRISFYN